MPFIRSAFCHSQAFCGVRALHASVPLHRMPFLILLAWELLSLSGLSPNTTASVKPPKVCEPRSRPDQCPSIPPQSTLAPHYAGSSQRAGLHPLPGSLAPSSGPGAVLEKCQTRPWACSLVPLTSCCCPFGQRDSARRKQGKTERPGQADGSPRFPLLWRRSMI